MQSFGGTDGVSFEYELPTDVEDIKLHLVFTNMYTIGAVLKVLNIRPGSVPWYGS